MENVERGVADVNVEAPVEASPPSKEMPVEASPPSKEANPIDKEANPTDEEDRIYTNKSNPTYDNKNEETEDAPVIPGNKV